jgi:hypothetical protein
MVLRARQKEREEVLNQFGRAQGVWISLTSTLDPGIMTPGDSRTTSIVDALAFTRIGSSPPAGLASADSRSCSFAGPHDRR